jgi:hypothetical protein
MSQKQSRSERRQQEPVRRDPHDVGSHGRSVAVPLLEWVLPFLLLALALVALLAARSPHFIPDDAYITFRYARNLAAGEGFVYNSGERVLGTSAPFWAILLAISRIIAPGLDTAVVAQVISIAFYLLAGVLVFLIVRWDLCKSIHARPTVAVAWGLLAAALWLSSQQAVDSALSGMETALFAFLILLAAHAFECSAHIRAGTVLGLALATRIDAIVAIVCLVIWCLVHKRRSIMPVLGSAFALALPWYFFSWLYFGSLWPNTVVAKTVMYTHTEWAWSRADILRGFIGGMSDLPLFLAALVGLLGLLRGRTVMWLAGFPFAYGIFCLVFVARPQAWYFVPCWPAAIVAAVTATASLSPTHDPVVSPVGRSWLARLVPGRGLSAAGAAASAGAIVLGVVAGWHGIRSMQGVREARHFPEDGLDEIGCHLAGGNSRGTVFIGDIGVVGWRSGLKVYDFAGLVTPEAIRWNRTRRNYSGRISIDYRVLLAQIARVRPDFVVLADYMAFRAEIVNAPEFKECYGEAMRAGENTLYKRRELGN